MRTLLARASVWHSAYMIIEHAHIDTDLKSYHGHMKQAKLHQSFYLPPALLFAWASEYMLRHCRLAREGKWLHSVSTSGRSGHGGREPEIRPTFIACPQKAERRWHRMHGGHTVAMFMMLVASMSCR